MDKFKKNSHLKLKNFIRLTVKGDIHEDDMNMLRVVFAHVPFTRQQFLQKNGENAEMKIVEKNIQEFVKKTAMKFGTMIQKMVEKRKQMTKNETLKLSPQ